MKDNNALNGTPANTLRDTSADAPPQDTLRDAPRIATPPFETDILIQPNRHGVYRYGALMVWILATTAMVLDRFYWNIWPRESICTHGCGKDICNIEEVRNRRLREEGRVLPESSTSRLPQCFRRGGNQPAVRSSSEAGVSRNQTHPSLALFCFGVPRP